MDGVSDMPFRTITEEVGQPAYTMTEFTAAEGIRAGALRLLSDLAYSPSLIPVVAQIFGSDPEAFVQAAAVSAALGFDGIDINMGCPAKNVTEHGAGAGLILDPPRARAIIEKTREGMQRWADGASLAELGVAPSVIDAVALSRESLPANRQGRRVLPISVKTRLGYREITVVEWMHELFPAKPDAITLHGRTLAQLYKGEAHWDAIGQATTVIKAELGIPVVGNGDISSLDDGIQRATLAGTDGFLVGRASMGNPWVFTRHTPTIHEKLTVALRHLALHEEFWGERGVLTVRKHLFGYISSHPTASHIRGELARATTYTQVRAILEEAHTTTSL